MIIKSCRRKDLSFDDLLLYLAAEGKSADKPLFHNFPAGSYYTLDDIIGAFMDNARYLRARRNGNVLYQEIIPFHPDDAVALTPAILRDLAARYLEWRAPGTMAYAAIHLDRAHPHIHLVISANLCCQPKKLRLSRERL